MHKDLLLFLLSFFLAIKTATNIAIQAEVDIPKIIISLIF